MSRSQEGYLWTPSGATEGLQTDAVVVSSPNPSTSYDVIVIGAGFAGLVAARDLSQNGELKVLIVEGRDRIGGRTWTARALGEEFEMGGTWVHWNQPHVYRELHRYSLHRNLKTSAGTFEPAANYYKPSQGVLHEVDIQASGEKNEKIAAAFFTIDDHTSRSLMPYPHDPNRSPVPWKQYDELTVSQRLDQMTQFSEADKEEFEALCNSLGSAPGTEIGFVELLRWYALGGHTMAQMFELAGVYKIGKGGMTSLAKAILSEFRGDVMMKTVVREIAQHDNEADGFAELRLGDGKALRAKQVISTIPLNCLSEIKFTPPLPPLRRQAWQEGHINKGAKIHFKLADVEKPWFATCSGRSNPPFCFAFSDHNGTKASGKADGTYCIGFGYNNQLGDSKDSKHIVQAFQESFRPKCDVQAYLTHDWMNDPLAKGVWSCWAPGKMSRYLEELQKPHGRVAFASADWADGWRGFVDGAIESGSKVARDRLLLLRSQQTRKSMARL